MIAYIVSLFAGIGLWTAIGVTLASPYPLPITGTLTLAFASSAFVDDPAIQFATGGRTLGLFSSIRGAQAAAEALRGRIDHPILLQGEETGIWIEEVPGEIGGS